MTFWQKYRSEFQLLLLAVICFTVTLLASIFILVRKDAYPESNHWKAYEAGRVSFEYPESWKVDFCSSDAMDFELPGKIATDTFGNKRRIYGSATGGGCLNGKPSVVLTEPSSCEPEEVSKEGVQLKNNLFVNLDEGDRLAWVSVGESRCSAGGIFTFRLAVPNPEIETPEPRIDKGMFMNSPQYKDIVKFAESIKIKD